ncbi:MAG: hypothetical protein KDD53_03615 [Bdellovibrionales bacterium]|nr:hypothetical protein [Bdellovibrionales bacterium]
MSQAFVPGLESKLKTVVARTRELPLEGEIPVRIGDQVSADTVVGSASLPGDLIIVRGPEELGIESFEVVEGLKRLGIKEGITVQAGQLLCEHSGLFGLFHSRLRSPVSGTIEFISKINGHVGIRLDPKRIEIKAFISGEVVDIQEKKSATIRTSGAFVQGIFGVGGERIGVLEVLSSASGKVEVENIPADIKGKIIVAGTNPSAEVLKIAAARGAVGMIVGAIDDEALKGFLGYDLGIALTGDEDISMTVIITEGFGTLNLSKRVLDVLKRFHGRMVSINGATQVRAGAVRPEIIIPHQEAFSEETTSERTGLDIGSRIRIIRVPYFGLEAELVELPLQPEKIPSGVVCRVLKAKLSNGEIVTIPRANVEIV